MALLQFDPNKYRTTQPGQPEQQEQGRFGDIVDAFQSGAASGLGGIFDFVGAQGVARDLYDIAGEQSLQMSQRGREAMAKPMFETDEFGDTSLGEGMTDLDTWLLGMSSVAGQMVPTMIPGAGAAGLATKALTLGSRGAKAAQMISMGATGGAAATGQAMEQARAEVLRMPDSLLADSEAFRKLFLEQDKADPTLTDLEKWDIAKTNLAEKIAGEVKTDPKTLLANFGASAIGDPIIGRALMGARLAKAGAFRSALSGAVTEGATEAAQAGTTQFSINQALAQIDDRDPMKGVKIAALNEAALGAGFGGIAGFGGGLMNRQPKAPAKSANADAVRDSNPGLAGAMDAMAQQDSDRQDDVSNISAQATAAQVTDYDQPTAARAVGLGGRMEAGSLGDQLFAEDAARRADLEKMRMPIVPEQEGEFIPAGQRAPISGLLGRGLQFEGEVQEPVPALEARPEPARIEDKGIIFAPDETGINVMRSGRPFASEQSALSSKGARAARKAGQQTEAVKRGDGFGWQIAEPVTVTPEGEVIEEAEVKKPEAVPTEKPVRQKVTGLQVVEAPIDELIISKDVPQFKAGADVTGVVEPLGGTFERTGVAPIQVWVRKDGRKEVISGRHRLDLAKRSGEKSLPAQYHYEDEGFTAQQAAALDATLNIREGQGKVKDYVDFIQATAPTEAEAKQQGILARATGKRAYSIATKGSDALITSHRNDVITDEAATRIADAAPNNEALQAVGLKALQEGKTIGVAENMVKAVGSMTTTQQQEGDLFGFDDSALKEAESMARKATRRQSEIQRTLSAVQGAAKRPDLAAKEGVDVKDPAAVKVRIAELKKEKLAWSNWHTNPELVEELRNGKEPDGEPEIAPEPEPEAAPDLFAEPVKEPEPVSQNERYQAFLDSLPEGAEPKNYEYMAFISDKGKEYRDSKGLGPTASISQDDGFTKFIQESVKKEIKTKKPEAKQPVRRAATAVYGAKNKLVSKDRAEELRAKLKAKIHGRLSAGIDPEILAIGTELAVFHIEAGARKFTDLARAIAEDLETTTARIKPYLRSWYNGARDMMEDSGFNVDDMDSPDVVRSELAKLEKAETDAERTARLEEPDRADRVDEVEETREDIQPEGRGQRRQPTAEPSERTGERVPNQAMDFSLSTTQGERSGKPVRVAEPRVARPVTGSADDIGSLPTSSGGLLAESSSSQEASNIFESEPAVESKTNKAALSETKVAGNLAQIKKQMPFLTNGHADDVVFAEDRFKKPEGYGVLFTNGTGTGKTFSGLGVAKRYEAEGKGEILIVVPKQPIADAWVKAGRDFFDMEISGLEGIRDAGKGVVVTTYANVGDNDALMSRKWDLIITDESHYLSSNAAGKITGGLTNIRAMSEQPGSAGTRVEALNPELMQEIRDLNSSIKDLRTRDDDRFIGQIEDLSKDLSAKHKDLDSLRSAEADRLRELAPQSKPRMVMLSATPFAYEKSVTLGQGYLFDWNEGNTENYGSAYNSGGNFEQFMMQHFGYRMRYNKLTEPDSKVDRALMQRAFNAWMKKEGVLSGRTLDTNYDYDRRFILTETAIGKRVDDALEWLWDKSSGDNEIPGASELREEISGENFKYQSRMYFLEAIKAREVVPIVQEHLALGRRVVLMHDFKRGGVLNPFIVTPTNETAQAYAAFTSEFKDLIGDFSALPSPIETLTEAFPDALVYNGDYSAKQRVIMQDEFNSDEAGTPSVIIAQGDAMREGVSIHDTTGDSQRALIHLGMPVKPTAAIQQEGRIYRTGQASDAIFRYLTIGSNWERYAFASTIATRAGTAENLAMGESARGLKQSFVSAYEEASSYPPGMKGEGKGGKEADQAMAKILTPWDFAKSIFFGTKKYGKGRAAAREGVDYFATPEPVGFKMVQFADIQGGEKVLEPSGGHGAIARWFPENTDNVAIEPSGDLGSRLALNFDGKLISTDFESHNIINKYDAIIMNPPYGPGGATAVKHVEKAIKHLRNGGRIVALIPTGPAADKKFEKLLFDNEVSKNIYFVANIKMPSSTFERAGTAVNTRILVLEKQDNPEVGINVVASETDLSGVGSNEQLFDRMENIEINPRQQVEEEITAAAPEAVKTEGVTTYTMDSKHTKTGADLYVVNVEGDLGDSYDSMNALARSNDGVYIRARMRSYYKPSDGVEVPGKPTFTFKTAEGRQAFLDGIETEQPSIDEDLVFRARPKGKPKRSISMKQAQAVVDKLFKNLHGAAGIKVELVPTQAEFERRQGKDYGGALIYGAMSESGNTAYLIVENFGDVEEARKTLAHEVIAHGGLRKVIGKLKFQEFIKRISSTKSKKEFKEVWAEIDRRYKGESEAVRAEEVFAYFVEQQPERGPVGYWWKSVTTWIRRQLESLGIVKKNDTKNDMEDMQAAIVRGFKKRSKRVGRVARAERVLRKTDYAPIEETRLRRDEAVEGMSAEDTRTAKEKLGLGAEAEETLSDKIKETYTETADTLKSSTFWQRINEGLFDALHGIKTAEEAAGISDPNKMGYVSARLASGLADVLHGVFNYGAPEWKDGIIQRKADTKGLLEVFGMLPEGDLNDWLAWMGANRAKQLMAEGRERNLTQQDIDELLALAEGKEALFEEVRQEYNKINSAILDVAQKSGLISDAQRAGFDEEYYVPFFREMEVDEEMKDIASMITAPFSKKGIANQSAKIKELKGGKQSTRDLLENIISRQSTLLDASLKNKAMMEITNNLEGTDYMTKVDSPEFAKLTQRELNSIQRVKVMIDGKPVAYAVSDPALLRGLVAVNDIGSNALFNRLGRSAKRFLTTGITLSPDFILKNFIRDAAHAWMINKDGFKFGADSIKGLNKAFKEDEAYKDLIFSGAAFQGGYIHGADPEAAAHQVRRSLAAKGLSKSQIDGYLGTIVTSGGKLLERYKNASDKVENANRLATYEAALAAGKTKRQAAFEAKDLMDYSMKGNFGLIATMIDFLPFFNARLQGMYKLGRAAAASGDKDRLLKVLSANLVMKGMKVAAFSLALAMMNGDDERYKELQDWDKDANWHFWIGEDHFRIPKPFELGIIFGTLPERAFALGSGSQTIDDTSKAVAHAVFNTLSLNPIPQIAMPIVEIMANKSFFMDRPIEGMADTNRMPGDRYNAYTSDTAKEIGKALNISPKKIEHLVKGYAGTLGGYVLSMSDIMTRQMLGIEKAETPISRYPIIKSFYTGSTPPGGTSYQTEFYEAINQANQAYGSYKAAAESQDSEHMMDILEKNKDKLSTRVALNRVKRQITKLSNQAKAVNNSNLSASEKRIKLEDITRRKNAIYQRAFVVFNLRDW